MAMEYPNMTIEKLLAFMTWSVESLYLDMGYFIELIDCRLSDYFGDYPILITLSLAKTQDEFLSNSATVLYSNNYKDVVNTDLSADEILLGFIIIAHQEHKLTKNTYQVMVADLFDVSPMVFTIEEIILFFEHKGEQMDDIQALFNHCESVARTYISEFYQWVSQDLALLLHS